MKYKKYFIIGFILLIIFLPFMYIIAAYKQSYDILRKGLEFQPYLSTQIYDVNGELISELFEENRSFIEIKKIPDHVKKAFIAAEDENFYLHPGIDLIGMIRAVVIDIMSGNIKQGGSTITQQLVKQLYTKREKTIKRKLIELFLTREFEKKYTKDKILEMYLNQVYFGHGVYGINAAAKFYFDLDADKLGVVEAALLASIPSAPNKFSPLKNPHIAFKKNQLVLYNMISCGYIDKDDAVNKFNNFWASYLETIKTKFQALGIRNKRFDKAPYFTEYIRKILIKKYGEEKVYRSGMKIYTTLDLKYQKIADDVLLEGINKQNKISGIHNKNKLHFIDSILARRIKSKKINTSQISKFLRTVREDSLDEIFLSSLIFNISDIETVISNYLDEYEKLKLSSRVEGALIALNPENGEILAMIGGDDFNDGNQLNRAVQSTRQPGSSFKAFVYGAGIESKKITAATAFLDAPIVFKGQKKGKREHWAPSNYEKSFYGKILVKRAFAASLNIVSVLILEKIGTKQVADFASKLMQVPIKRFEIDPTLALGTTELSPLEMAQGFAVYANNGKEVFPYSIRYILNNNNKIIYNGEIFQKNRIKKQIITPETAFIMTNLLREVVDHGTAYAAIRKGSGFSMPAAGKTGTNTDFRDAWFVGYTPDIVAAVWMGCDSQKFTLGGGQSAAAVAAPIWGNFMSEVYKIKKPGKFRPAPKGVAKYQVCDKTGKIPINGCKAVDEYFIIGTEPNEKCNSDHNEMISIFDLIRKNKDTLIDKAKLKIEDKELEIPSEEGNNVPQE